MVPVGWTKSRGTRIYTQSPHFVWLVSWSVHRVAQVSVRVFFGGPCLSSSVSKIDASGLSSASVDDDDIISSFSLCAWYADGCSSSSSMWVVGLSSWFVDALHSEALSRVAPRVALAVTACCLLACSLLAGRCMVRRFVCDSFLHRKGLAGF